MSSMLSTLALDNKFKCWLLQASYPDSFEGLRPEDGSQTIGYLQTRTFIYRANECHDLIMMSDEPGQQSLRVPFAYLRADLYKCAMENVFAVDRCVLLRC